MEGNCEKDNKNGEEKPQSSSSANSSAKKEIPRQFLRSILKLKVKSFKQRKYEELKLKLEIIEMKGKLELKRLQVESEKKKLRNLDKEYELLEAKLKFMGKK